MTTERSILLAVANAELADYAERRLRRRGYRVETTPEPVRAAARAAAQSYSAIVFDRALSPRLRSAAGAPVRIALADGSGDGGDGEPRTLTLLTPFEVALLPEVLEGALRRRPGVADAAPPRRAAVRTGVDVFDTRYGGIPRGRALCLSGPPGSGISVFALQFLARGLARGERGLLVSNRTPADVGAYARTLGLPLDDAIESGRLLALIRAHYAPETPPESAPRPPEQFEQLAEIILSNHVRRAVLDPCLPWLAGRDTGAAVSFVRAFERMGITIVLTLPRPVSVTARSLRAALEGATAVAARLTLDAAGNRVWRNERYEGMPLTREDLPIVIQSGIGLRSAAPTQP